MLLNRFKKKLIHRLSTKYVIERISPNSKYFLQKLFFKDHIERYNFAKSYVNSKMVLDVACGFGYGVIPLLKNKPIGIIGIDNSRVAISFARTKYLQEGVKFIRANATKIPYKDNYFDVVISFETIEHINNYNRFLSEIRRVLKPNGVLILSTPNKKVWEKLLGGNIQDYNPYHIREFTSSEMKSILRNYFKSVKLFRQRVFQKKNNALMILSVVFSLFVKPRIKNNKNSISGMTNVFVCS